MGFGMARQLYLFNMANPSGAKGMPEDELHRARASESARRSWLERDPSTGKLRVNYRPEELIPLPSPSSAAVPASSRFDPRQAYAILDHSDSEEPNSHIDLRRRLNDAAKYANMPRDLVPHLPADFAEARAVYDSLRKRLFGMR